MDPLATHGTGFASMLRRASALAALVLVFNLSGLAPALASAAGQAGVDLCDDGCATGPFTKCPPACVSCTNAVVTRAVPPAAAQVPPPMRLELPTAQAVSRLLGPPQRVDADGVFHPPRASAAA